MVVLNGGGFNDIGCGNSGIGIDGISGGGGWFECNGWWFICNGVIGGWFDDGWFDSGKICSNRLNIEDPSGMNYFTVLRIDWKYGKTGELYH